MQAASRLPSDYPADEPLVRAFIGILVPPAAELLESLRSDAALATLPVRWLAPEGLHVTLAFLGEVPRRSLAASWPALAAEADHHRSATLRLAEPEPFPDAQRPRLVVAPLRGDMATLEQLHAGLTDVLGASGFAVDERPFRAHVSLGRLRGPLLRGQAAELSAALRSQSWDLGGPFVARQVVLMRSDLFPDGARYTVLAEAAMAEKR